MGKLQKAIRLEKQGKYKTALKIYQKISGNNLSEKDYLYVRRSIAACLYYLKEYDKALSEYEKILKDFSLETGLQNQIEDNMHLCLIYGNSTQKGIEYFKDRIIKSKQKSESNCWWYWYVGQGFQLLEKYEEAEKSYKRSYKMSKELNFKKAGFFLLYTAVINILNKNIKEAEKVLSEYENLYKQNIDNGLFYILNGIVIMEKDPVKGRKMFNKGIKEAEKAKWQENIDLADKLNKAYKSIC